MPSALSQHADLDRCRQVTALVGDNGAGKSTLVRCLTGVHSPDEGEILFEGEPRSSAHPRTRARLGVETVYQDLASSRT